jgi:hypothetical protein
LIELYRAWLEFISTAMVKRTRFDPLHDAATEQRLFDDLPALARNAEISGSATAVVSRGSERFEIDLTRDQLAQAAAPIYRQVASLLHQLRPAGAPIVVVAPSLIAGLPGMRQELEQFAGCELVGIADGYAAAAASLLDIPERGSGDSVLLRRRLPLHAGGALEDMASREPLGKRRVGSPAPTHVLHDGRAYSLGGDTLVVGRDSASGGHAVLGPRPISTIVLPDGLAGVSRRHCTFVRDGGELVLLDHSSFGTFVNGERVAERVRVHSGDHVRLGEPGVDLALIALD